ncbi:hypothetical protein B5V89_06265 [Heyndrickxia sporothermodurans]|nr:hypothetical protein B5V89_06265 [Heyndrickxia sporothermodurans]
MVYFVYKEFALLFIVIPTLYFSVWINSFVGLKYSQFNLLKSFLSHVKTGRFLEDLTLNKAFVKSMFFRLITSK